MDLKQLPYKLVKIKARDWGLSEPQYRIDGEWRVVIGYISGWLIAETKDAVTISQQLFHQDGSEPHWDTRYTITIPKETILEREMITERQTHRSKSGTKLYAVRDAKGRLEDIKAYKRAHKKDLKMRPK